MAFFWGTMPQKYGGKAKFGEPTPLPSIAPDFSFGGQRVLQIAPGRAHMLILLGTFARWTFANTLPASLPCALCAVLPWQ